MSFMRGDSDGYSVLLRKEVSLRLISVMMRVEDVVDLRDAEFREVAEDCSGAKIDQNSPVPLADEIDVAGVGEVEEVF